jgi:putative acetyltransferase
MQIQRDDLTSPQVIELLQEHVRSMRAASPPESCHVLDLEELRSPSVTFWGIWNGSDLAGCAALKELDPAHGEIKSMRTATAYLRKGIASRLLAHIFEEAKRRSYRRLSLETGAQDCFEAARKLYSTHGFKVCEPFGSYWNDPNSVFMNLEI